LTWKGKSLETGEAESRIDQTSKGWSLKGGLAYRLGGSHAKGREGRSDRVLSLISTANVEGSWDTLKSTVT